METLGALDGGPLELRRESNGSVRLTGRFPYNTPALLTDGGRSGRPVKEMIAPGAFSYTIEDAEADVHFLLGHSFDKPLASKRSGTLRFRETDAALLVAATVTPAIMRASYAQDAIAQVEAGLATGLSPGFRLPPERAVPRDQAEEVTEEPDRPDKGMHRAVIRRIRQAILVEFSLVVRPAYAEATVEAARSWQPPSRLSPMVQARRRWRA